MQKEFSSETMTSPGIYGVPLPKNRQNIIRLKFNRTSTRSTRAGSDSPGNVSTTSELSSPEKLDHAKGLMIFEYKTQFRDKIGFIKIFLSISC